MVGYDKNSLKHLKSTDFAIAGGGSGFITRALCQPLDVLKIRFQLQVEPISNNSVAKYRSVLQATHLIYREEGIKAFWKGHVPAQFLSISYGIVQFGSFELLTFQAEKLNYSKNWKPVVNFTCGAVAGGCATLASFPFDVIRTRLVAQSELNKVYKSLREAAQNMLKKEGPLVLFRGLWPTVLQIAPHAGCQFMCYKLFEDMYKYIVKNETATLSSSLISGSLAGLCAKTFIYPFDLAKKRMQIQGFEEARQMFGRTFKCNGFLDCVVRIYQIEGVPGLFKGLSPSLLKAVCTTAIHFSSYEMICITLNEYRRLSTKK